MNPQVTLPHSARDEADFRVANGPIFHIGVWSMDHVATTAMEHLVIVTRPVTSVMRTFLVSMFCRRPRRIGVFGRARQKAIEKKRTGK